MRRTERRPADHFCLIALLALGILLSARPLPADEGDDKSDNPPPVEWTPLANGVWSASAGSLEGQLKYSDLAAGPPRREELEHPHPLPLPLNLRDVSFRVLSDHRVMVRIPTSADEKIYGFGLQFDGVQKNGRVLDLKVDHFARGGGATHAPVPFFVSNKGYGVFFNTPKYIKVHVQVGNRKDSPRNPEEVDRNPPDDEPQPGPWLAQPPGDAVEAWIHGDGLEIIGFAGTSLQDVVARYNLFSGGGAMPPLWGLGFWHRVPAKFTADETQREIDEFNLHEIPLDVIGLEPGWQTKSYPCTFEWQKKRFPDPAAFAQTLLDDGIRLNLWENPYISQHAGIYEAMAPLSGSHLVWLGLVPDYRLPEAGQVLIEQHKIEHFDIGISGYKIDEVDGYDNWLWPDHATFPSGTSAEVMRQTYGLQLQHLLYHGLFRKHNRRTYGLVRASNGAASGYPFALYSDSYRHDQYVTGLSTSSLCGILWCPEIRSARSAREWINRVHTVCFSPMAMLNAWASGTKPWSFPDATEAVRDTIQLRMQLLPYLYTAFSRYHRQGIPPVRAMILEDGREDNSVFMFGPDILVAPFHGEDTTRPVQLPAGRWFDFHTGRLAGDGEMISVNAEDTANLPPMFVRDGAVIPMLAEPVLRTKQIPGAALEIRHYGTVDGTCELYEDDGSTFDFEHGTWRLRQMHVQRNANANFELSETVDHDQAPALYGSATLRQMKK